MSAITEIDISSKQTGNKNVKYVECRKEDRKERKEEERERKKIIKYKKKKENIGQTITKSHRQFSRNHESKERVENN
jgi:hypothetical protein